MKLVKIESYGFKSFADRISLSFNGGIVGIVGPNGSGKSNINDAIKWVLGEQSSKALRGDKMEDVIFAGSKTVKSLNKAEVILTFDNTNNMLKNQPKIITISRVIERGKGSNIYLINGEIARQKDIKEIAMESGMSKSSLAIISQGTISQIAQASPEERRKVFEEAAGTSKYKSHKLETLRKLNRTVEALDKIKTIINELNKQLAPLEKQAKNASVYLEKSKSLKSIEVALIAEQLTFFNNKIIELKNELKGVEETKELLEKEISKYETIIENESLETIKLQDLIAEIQNSLNKNKDEMLDLEKRENKISEQRKLIISGGIKSNDIDKIKALKTEIKELNKNIMHYNAWKEKIEKNISEKIELNEEKQSSLIELKNTLYEKETKYNRTKIALDVFKDTYENKTNLFKGTKTIVNNANLFSGYIGLVNEIIQVENYYKVAIESVLKNALQHIVMETSKDAIQAVHFLKKNKGGVATFIPYKTINEKFLRDEHELVLEAQKGFLDIASNLIQIEDKYLKLSKFLLGNIVIVDDIQNANHIGKIIRHRYMIVTLDGDIIRSGGVISGGQKQASHNLLGLKENIENLQKIIPNQKEKITYLIKQIDVEEIEIQNLRKEISVFSQDLERVKQSLKNSQNNFDSTKTQYESLSNKKIELDSNIDFSNEIRKIEIKNQEMESSLKTNQEQKNILVKRIAEAQIKKSKNERSLRVLLEDFNNKIIKKERFLAYVNQNAKRLSEHYEMTLDYAIANFSLKMSKEESKKIVQVLTKEIKALGNINLDAINAYKEVNERHTDLTQSLKELENAREVILNAIEELDKIIIARMSETVNIINQEFNNIFKNMFGGGLAEIKFVDPNDILESGINIIAQPPGKSIKNLKLFSSGEKSLIAISLLFAILKAKPLPLCILDEVEAALDETNVIRYAEFLQKLKDKTQFIVITHRQGTMARVDHLFGATMQKRGVTSFFSVDINTAKTLIEKESEKKNDELHL